MHHFKYILFFLIYMAMSFLASCDAGNGKSHYESAADTIAIKYAKHLTMVDYGDFVKVDFRNPWDTSRILHTYILVPRQAQLPEALPDGIVLRTPLQKTVVYTTVHSSLIDELGAIEAISGVCDSKYISNEALQQRIAQGAIADCGNTMAPNLEAILMLHPDAILLSAFENSNDHNKVAQLGIPIVDCIDYMEPTPLARAEWMRFYGRLFGASAKADSMFLATEQAYLDTRQLAARAQWRPIVIADRIYGQSWNMPAAYSTAGVLIEDAGGINPFDVYKQSGSVQLSPEEVLYTAREADLWLIRYAQEEQPTLTSLAKDNGVYSQFKAYDIGNVYGCDTQNTSYFDAVSFHPHWILAEYVNLFHPELPEIEYNHHFYSKLQP